MANTTRSGRYAPVGFEQIVDLSSAVGLTPPAAANLRASCALIQVETQNVRWRDDGNDPTSTVGMILLATGDIFYDGNLTAIRLIETAASAKVNVTYYEDTRGGQ